MSEPGLAPHVARDDAARAATPSAAAARWAVPALLALLAALHAASFLDSGPLDDDFILLRYARNLVDGYGLVFNPGERFEGFVVPGWVLVLAAGLALGIPGAALSAGLSILAAAAAVGFTARLWRELAPRTRFHGPALLLAACPAFAYHAIVGLGTAPLAALLALWLLLYQRAVQSGRRAGAAALTIAGAMLLRPDAALFGLPFALAEWRRKRSYAGLLAFAPLLAWTLFRKAYYGRWLPIPYHTKKLPFLVDVQYGLVYLGWGTLATGIGVLAILGLAWFAGAGRQRSIALVVAMTGLCAHVLYVVYVGGDFILLGRFFMPVLPIALLLGTLGARRIVSERPRVLFAAGLAAAILLQWPQLWRERLRSQHFESEQRWAAMGRELRLRAAPGTRVALAPIGAFGFYSRLPIVDMLGLTHAAFLDVAPDLSVRMKSHQRHDGLWVLAQKPDIIILGNGWLRFADGTPTLSISRWEQSLAAAPEFQRDYVPMTLAIPESYMLPIHVRRGSPVPEGATP